MKAQVSFEYYFSLVLFVMFAMYVVFQTISVTSVYRREIRSRLLKAEAYQISELLVNDLGEPVNWETQGSWLTGWQYRIPITVNNMLNTNSLTDYQVLLNLDTASLISAGKMNLDCSDVRFTDSDGTAISFWIDSGCNTANTIIWVKVPSIPASATKTIYVYYGNNTPVTSESNATATFLFFDDFSTNPNAKWLDIFRYSGDTTNEFSWDSGAGILYLTRAANDKGSGGTMIFADSTWENGWEITFRFKAGGGSGADGIAFGFFHQGNAWNGETFLSVGQSGYAIELDNYKSINDATANHIAVVKTSSGEAATGYTHLIKYDTPVTEDNNWHTIMVRFFNDNIKVYLDGTSIIDYTTAFDKSYKRFLFGAATGAFNNNHIIDDIKLRKYTSPEPTTSIGAEEESVEVKRIGLSDQSKNMTNLISITKIQAFQQDCSTDYNSIISKLGVIEDYQFEINITDLTSGALLASCLPPNRVFREETAEITRITALDTGSYAKVTVRVW